MKDYHAQFVSLRSFPIVPRYRWWDRFRWWLVRKLGGEDPNATVKIVRVLINEDKFLDAIYKQRRELIGVFHRQPTRLLIGAEDYAELMATEISTQSFRFDISANRGRPTIFGLTVEVIPWMRGLLVMP